MPTQSNAYLELAKEVVDDIPVEPTRPCSCCGRNFRLSSLKGHEVVCKKITVNSRVRGKFDSTSNRLRGITMENAVQQRLLSDNPARSIQPRKKILQDTTKETPASGCDPKKEIGWKAKRADFIEAVRSARQATRILKNGGTVADLPPPKPSKNLDYLDCQHCARRFNESAYERHVQFCSEQSKRYSNKPTKDKLKAKEHVMRRQTYQAPLSRKLNSHSRSSSANNIKLKGSPNSLANQDGRKGGYLNMTAPANSHSLTNDKLLTLNGSNNKLKTALGSTNSLAEKKSTKTTNKYSTSYRPNSSSSSEHSEIDCYDSGFSTSQSSRVSSSRSSSVRAMPPPSGRSSSKGSTLPLGSEKYVRASPFRRKHVVTAVPPKTTSSSDSGDNNSVGEPLRAQSVGGNPRFQSSKIEDAKVQNPYSKRPKSLTKMASNSKTCHVTITTKKNCRFCHECGGQFLVQSAKFCHDCGTRRMVREI